MVQLKEHLAGLGHEEDAFGFPAGVILDADRGRVAVAEVDLAAESLGDAGGQGDLDAALLDAVLEGADAADVGASGPARPRDNA